jgi:hypothetical protein
MYNMTPGMRRAYFINRKLKLKGSCTGCGLAVPVYAGKYPETCPHCDKDWNSMNSPVQQNEDVQDKPFSLEDAIQAVQFKRMAPAEAFSLLLGEDTTTNNIAQTPPAPLVFPKEKDAQKQRILALLNQVTKLKRNK